MCYNYTTTFWSDFTIAEKFGTAAIKDTAARAFSEWKDDIQYLTELVMVINHKCWEHYHNNNNELSNYYGDLYYEYYEKALNYLDQNGRQDAIHYFLKVLD